MEEQNQSDKIKDVAKINPESTQVAKSFDPIIFFKKDKKFVFTHQKIEKLISAVYLITNSFQESEPVKWSLRALGAELLRLNIDLKESSNSDIALIENRIRERVLEMVSLLEVTFFAGLISEMNLLVIKREFHNLLNYINLMLREKKEGSSIIGSQFFDIEELPQSAPFVGDLKPAHLQKMSNIDDSAYVTTNLSQNVVKDKNQIERRTEPAPSRNFGNKLKEYGPVAVKRSKRQSAIINLLKRKKEIMVRDVAEVVHDCSEKTLQRELLTLVSQGILKKEGDRRWSRYSLI